MQYRHFAQAAQAAALVAAFVLARPVLADPPVSEVRSFYRTGSCPTCEAGQRQGLDTFRRDFPRNQVQPFREWADSLCFQNAGRVDRYFARDEQNCTIYETDSHNFQNVAGALGPIAYGNGACHGHSKVTAA